MPPAKLYIVVRADLPPGLQLAQAVHAAFQFQGDRRRLVRKWLEESNYLVCLSVPDEESLLELAAEACLGRGIPLTLVREPDLGDEATALALAPGERAQVLCASLPLALREVFTV